MLRSLRKCAPGGRLRYGYDLRRIGGIPRTLKDYPILATGCNYLSNIFSKFRINRLMGYLFSGGMIKSFDGSKRLQLYVYRHVDIDAYMKAYYTFMMEMFGLTTRSVDVYLVMCSYVERGTGLCNFDRWEVAARIGIDSPIKVYRHLVDLLRAGLIRRTESFEKFWINDDYCLYKDQFEILNVYVLDERDFPRFGQVAETVTMHDDPRQIPIPRMTRKGWENILQSLR